ncbi:hypothetical protein [Microbulbifer thermotolerans]|uniref:Uncharacterized protein n=1 Tax=Microbulbifer thermotolerans TaxID=252514 RepID=A0A143HMC3_MICTH|nr:hypothetical protein [Microbulbifer thermotolerans]AMX02681.1 hypothetical protein A3224_08885 [Microbulbifer thermotolerans]MCX2832653.1 hypothetical protein [Microbulbifer thermotolerans]SFB90245.1 hypothetical protein SAMN05660479_00791 [Microbulbifer thermotolerans]
MRQFSILVVFALAFGGAAVMYEKESRKVKGVLTQITELQAQLGDLQAEVNRLSGELEAVKLAQRRHPDLKTISRRIHRSERAASSVSEPARTEAKSHSGKLIASDVTTAPPAIHGRRNVEGEDSEWDGPTTDAEPESQELLDPYQ